MFATFTLQNVLRPVPHQRRAFIASSIAAPICDAESRSAQTRGQRQQCARAFAGDATTVTPAARSAAILSLAVPLPPEMIAPACPIRRPGGAVRPAMKDTTGLVVFEAWKRNTLVRDRQDEADLQNAVRP